jgi:hypothetical protein
METGGAPAGARNVFCGRRHRAMALTTPIVCTAIAADPAAVRIRVNALIRASMTAAGDIGMTCAHAA